jgi:hypothetical protein
MSRPWAASLPLARSADALMLWRIPGVEVCPGHERLWMRGENLDEALDRSLRTLLGCERFFTHENGLITPVEAALPVERLPDGPWQPLTQWFRIAPPRRHFAARTSERVALELVRSEWPQSTNVLVAPFAAWRQYAERAPRIRLQRWTFAVSDDLRVVIRGTPSPPLAGTHFVETAGVALPAGWTWALALDAPVRRAAFELADGDLALLACDGTYERIAGDAFVAATRSAVRLSAGGAAC